MKGNFDRCLALLFGDEGGYANDPRDNGGPTNFGITQATFDNWRVDAGRATEPVRKITRAEAADIYLARYWNAVRADELPAGLDYVVFDGAVNSGPGRSVKWLQQALMIQMDGVVGPATLAAVAMRDPAEVIGDIKVIRMAYLRGLDDWPHFGRGWTNRVNGVTKDALAMVSAPPSTVGPEPASGIPGTVSAPPRKPVPPAAPAPARPAKSIAPWWAVAAAIVIAAVAYFIFR